MLSPKLRSKVYNLWTKFWASGMTNPLTSIEQITYLIFLKQLEMLDKERVANGLPSIYGSRDFDGEKCNLPHDELDDYDAENEICHGHHSCRWSVIKEKGSPKHLRDIVFPWLRQLDVTLQKLSGDDQELQSATGYMNDAFFQLPQEKERTLQSAIQTIDELFKDVGSRSVNADLMGDIFEHMLERIQSSGQNGQFRTPRHIIRFMIELLDPEPGAKILDPAVGTAGFLVNSIQHIRKKLTPPEQIVYEWDGTPHRLAPLTLQQSQQFFKGIHFVGYDMDRTMVRIGWMNLILHGIENPKIERRDALSQSVPESETGNYQYILANPPYSGNIDKGDIHKSRIPRHQRGKKIKNSNEIEPISDRTELLFIWLILDLLEVGGKAAVVVPEGLLFGSSVAHRKLRQELLFDHKLHAVVSLPGGVFEPYSGVKTSIILFEKCSPRTSVTAPPNTEKVWFYEIAADGYSLDKKRMAQPSGQNDLWDALYKYQHQDFKPKTYFQPNIKQARWQLIDDTVIQNFPFLEEKRGQLLGIDERFPNASDGSPLSAHPEKTTAFIIEKGKSLLAELYLDYVGAARAEAEEASSKKNKKGDKRRVAKKVFTDKVKDLSRLLKEQSSILEEPENKEGGYGRAALKTCQEVGQDIGKQITQWVSAIANEETLTGVGTTQLTETEWQERIKNTVLWFAYLDGYNVTLLDSEPIVQEEKLQEAKGWYAPVRQWIETENWEDETARSSFIASQIDTETGLVSDTKVLDVDCIEANDFNISAGRYKPFELEMTDIEPPAEIIRAIQGLEQELLLELSSLLSMVEEN